MSHTEAQVSCKTLQVLSIASLTTQTLIRPTIFAQIITDHIAAYTPSKASDLHRG